MLSWTTAFVVCSGVADRPDRPARVFGRAAPSFADTMTSDLHDRRLDAVVAVLRDEGARTIVDLGCGDGSLLARLSAQPWVERVMGVEQDAGALARAAARVREDPRITTMQASVLEPLPIETRPDAAVLVEVVEHLEPSRLHGLERRVFSELRPRLVVITTPNADFNPLLGVPSHRFRHREHRFEWGRGRFRAWSNGVAGRNGYRVAFSDLPATHPRLGGPSQMAVFEQWEGAARRRTP